VPHGFEIAGDEIGVAHGESPVTLSGFEWSLLTCADITVNSG